MAKTKKETATEELKEQPQANPEEQASNDDADQSILKEAAMVAEAHGASRLWRNTQGEYFTERQYALASEGGKEENVKLFEF